MRFIGSKVNLLEDIELVINENITDKSELFLDIFSGTGIVGEYFKKDYTIASNDILYFSYILQKSKIENNIVPVFDKLNELGIIDVLLYLENEPFEITEEYFITKNYSPYELSERMYFTVENASRIDFIRLKINEWKEKNLIDDQEYTYLLAVLIEAVPFISNISGTYGAYLKHWDTRALGKLKLRPIEITNNYKSNISYNKDANSLIGEVEGDILYIDPPYNGRQYVSNYHVLETIAKYDNPDIYGKTGLRPYANKRSKYCLKREVVDVFEDLIKKANFRHIILSYSSDGLLSEKDIEEILIKYGIEKTYKLYKIPYRKYKSKHRQENKILYEYLFYIQKDTPLVEVEAKRKEVNISSYERKNYVKSPLNYVGGKYKLLKQILPLFPPEIDNFIDLFSGGLNVGANVKANVIYANDINTYVIGILKMFKEEDIDNIIKHIEYRISQFNLSKTNKEGFLEFREFYNQNKNPLDLYTLICFSFNYQFRFNNNHRYNNPFGKNRSQFSETLKQKLITFVKTLQDKKIIFSSLEFQKFDFSALSEKDLVYCDPPYLITTGSYNDGNRGFKDWNEVQEIKLLELLDELNTRNIKFALSNVLTHKGEENIILTNWSKNYNIHYLNHNYSNSSHNAKKGNSQEVLITNY